MALIYEHDAEVFLNGLPGRVMTPARQDKLRELACQLAELGDDTSQIADAVAMSSGWPRKAVSVDIEDCPVVTGMRLIAVHLHAD